MSNIPITILPINLLGTNLVYNIAPTVNTKILVAVSGNNATFKEASSGTPTTIAQFIFDDLPQYLIDNSGVYLGYRYPLKLAVNGLSFYMIPNPGTAIYKLVDTIPADNTLVDVAHIAFLTEDIVWSIDTDVQVSGSIDISTNFGYTSLSGSLVFLAQAGFILQSPSISKTIPMIYPVLSCKSDCVTCGYCPDNFSCSNAFCSTEQSVGSNTGTFGIRIRSSSGDEYVLTYNENIPLGSSMSTGYLLPEDEISVDILSETPTLFTEQWFYVDLFSGDTELKTNKQYPIYVIINGVKKFIKIPTNIQYGESFPIDLLDQSGTGTLTLTPSTTGNWGSYFLTGTSDFTSSSFPSGAVALWQNFSLLGTPAIGFGLPAPSSSTIIWIVVAAVVLLFIVGIIIVIFLAARPQNKNTASVAGPNVTTIPAQ